MIYKNIKIKNETYWLRKMTKTQVQNVIREKGYFHGFLCGKNTHPEQIADDWHFGVEIKITDLDTFEQRVEDFKAGHTTHTPGLITYTPGLGQHPHYYQIIKTC
ncbi:hypothetical protein [Shouchella clausii]|uniref:Uncharacterized protein n=1 Tax=Shouchella clausii TaxID=79880 RepID=A0A268S4H1_SHOCL|nr:hypothetical protein [Shouchella clausii]PAE87745.1 hypothetical protein CHH72_16580 [Shouchella clausii]PAF27317.1 hypothetical protein CHH61_04095 [Shouchella clausii]